MMTTHINHEVTDDDSYENTAGIDHGNTATTSVVNHCSSETCCTNNNGDDGCSLPYETTNGINIENSLVTNNNNNSNCSHQVDSCDGDCLAMSQTTNVDGVLVQGMNNETHNSSCRTYSSHGGDDAIQQLNLNKVGNDFSDTIADAKTKSMRNIDLIGVEDTPSNQTIQPMYFSTIHVDASATVVDAKNAIRAVRDNGLNTGSMTQSTPNAKMSLSEQSRFSPGAVTVAATSATSNVSEIEASNDTEQEISQLSRLEGLSTVETLLARRIAQRESFFSRAIPSGGVGVEPTTNSQASREVEEGPTIMTAELVTENSDPLVEERDRVIREARSILASEAVRAEPVAMEHDGKQSRYVVVGGVAIMITIAAVALVVGIQLTPSESSANQAKKKLLPTLAPTGMITPTSAPAVYGSNGYRVFTTTSQLRTAVAAYIENARTGDLSNNSDVAMEYGYPIGTWDVSRITDFSRIFDPQPDQRLELNRNPRLTSDFDEDLSGWDVSNGVTMYGMFAAANSFTGKGIEHWNVSRIIDFSFMFAKAHKFNGNISLWKTSNAENMDCMFLEAQVFNGDVSSWDVFKVTSMSHMFRSASAFNGGDLREWNVSNVKNMESMFHISAFNGKVSTWDTSRVTNMKYMFALSNFNDDLSFWRVGNVLSMQGMFLQASSYQGGDLSRWDTSRTTDMSQIFSRAYAFQGDISQWDVSNVVNFQSAFEWAKSFDGDLSHWKMGKVKNMESMFFRAELFSGRNLSSWDTHNVETMTIMFRCAYAFNIDISRWNVSSLKYASYMFQNATAYNQSLCSWGRQLSGTVNLTRMFIVTACANVSDPSMIDYSLGPYCGNCVESK